MTAFTEPSVRVPVPVTSDNAVADAWRTDRAYLVDLAYRMLRDVGAAEDVVQEAFARLSLTPAGEVRDGRGWLTVVVSRLCLDQLRSARHRRELPRETAWLDALQPLGGLAPVDPADRVTLDEEVQSALAQVLDRLGPAERVAFVLHDVFQLSFDRIGETLGRSPATCRQLAHRARQKVRRADPPPGPGQPEPATEALRTLADAFLAACASGDLDSLTAVLHPQAWGVVDFVTGTPPQPRMVRSDNQIQHGRPVVAATLLRWFGPRVTLVTVPTTSGLRFLAVSDRRPYALITATVQDGLMAAVHVVTDPQARSGA